MQLPHARITLIAATILLTACGKQEDPPPPVSSEPATTDSSGVSVMLRGEFQAPDGAVLTITETLSIENASILQRIGENEATGTMDITQTERQTIRFLENGTREITIGEGGSQLVTRMGELDPIAEQTPDKLTGKTIIAKLAPNREWTYAFKDEPTAEVPEGFTAADLRSNELYPTDWKDFGESWNPAPSAVSALLGSGFQITKGDIEMRALNYARRNGQPCAEVAADINATGLFQSDHSRQDISIKLKGKLYRSLDLYLDLEAQLSGNIEMYKRLGNADTRIEGPVTFKRTATWDPTPDAVTAE